MMIRKYSDADYAKYGGEQVYGRVRKYDPEKGYGYIFMENGKDIFVSSFALANKKDQKRFFLGTTVSFIVQKRNQKYYAENIRVIDYISGNDKLILPNGTKVSVKKIAEYRMISGDKACEINGVKKEEVIAHNIELWEMEYVSISFIRNGGEYRIFKTGSRFKGEGQVDSLKKYLQELDEKFLYL